MAIEQPPTPRHESLSYIVDFVRYIETGISTHTAILMRLPQKLLIAAAIQKTIHGVRSKAIFVFGSFTVSLFAPDALCPALK